MVNLANKSNKTLTLGKLFQICELVFVFLSLFIFSGGILVLIVTRGASEGDGSDLGSYNYLIINALKLIIYCTTFLLLVLRWKKVLAVVSKDRYITIYLAVFLLSCLWSQFPNETIEHSILGIGATSFGLYLATRYTLKEQLRLLFWWFVAVLILSIIFAVALPSYGLEQGIHAGALRGIFNHKNGFGQRMVMGTIIFLINALDKDKNSHGWFSWFCVVSSIVLIILCQSGNALVSLTLVLVLLFIYRMLRSRYEIMISAFLTFAIIGLMGITWFTSNEKVVFAAIGRDATLTGRTEIWQYVWDMIQQRPWLGYGYKGFWHYLDGPSAYVNLAFGPYGGGGGVPHSHNGFLEILLAAGILGLSVFLIGFIVNIFKAVALIRANREMKAFWPLLFMTYIMIANLAETSFGSLDNIFWILYSATIFSLLTPQFRGTNKYDN